MSTVKKRNWAFVLYPESAPDNWREILTQSGLQAAISPLHDKDLNATGEPKKPHWHVIACYQGPTSYNVVCKLSQETLKGTIPQPLEQVRGYYRYLTHKDNPEKVQYEEKDITTINGFNILDYVEMSRSEIAEKKREIHKFIRDNDIIEYSDLMDLLLDAEMYAEHDIAASNTMFFNSYLKSRAFKKYGKKTAYNTIEFVPERYKKSL